MNHWQMIAVAYTLTIAAILLEVAFLLRRRRAAVRQAKAWPRFDDPSTAVTATNGGAGTDAAAAVPGSAGGTVGGAPPRPGPGAEAAP